MGIGKRIKDARENLNLTQSELGALVGVTGSAITNYEKETSHPKEQIMYKLIEALNIDANYLFQDVVNIPSKKNDVTLAEYSRIQKYRALDEHGKDIVDTILEKEEARVKGEQRKKENNNLSQCKTLPAAPTKTISSQAQKCNDGIIEIKVYDQPAAAGIGNYLEEPDYHMEQFPISQVPNKTDFGIKISGDSMEPNIPDGSTVFVQASIAIDSNKIGIFILNGQAYCKKLFVDKDKQEIRLVSLNSKYDDIIIRESDDFRTVGQVWRA